MKVRTLLVAAVMFFALSAAAFAQATFSVGSTPVTAVIANGLTEKTGDITFTVTSGQSQVGTIAVNYSGVPITNYAPADNIVVKTFNDAGVELTGASAATLNLSTGGGSSLSSGILVINVPVGLANGYVIRLSGARVAVANTGLTSLNAQISTTVNGITAGQTVVQVISAISPAITVSGDKNTVTINSIAPASATAHMNATEVFLNAFGKAADDGNHGAAGNPGSLMVRFTLNQAPPEGATLTFPNTLSFPTTGGTPGNNTSWELADESGVPTGADGTIASTDTDLVVYYKLATDSDPIILETLSVPVTISFKSGTTVVGASKITFTATVAPIGTSTGTNSTLVPRYTVSESAAADLIAFTGSSTAILIPYANVATEISYDTGIAISNTTVDPGSSSMGGIGAAVPQPGSFTVYFFPQSGADFSVSSTAAGFPGTGLDATGKVPAGGTFVALLSQIVKAAQTANPTITIPDDFTGYLIIVTNFTNAHGLATVSNFQTYTQASPMLIIQGESRTAEKGLNN